MTVVNSVEQFAESIPATGSQVSFDLGFKLKLKHSCYAINLRAGGNPLVSHGLLSTNIKLMIDNQEFEFNAANYPTIVALESSQQNSNLSAIFGGKNNCGTTLNPTLCALLPSDIAGQVNLFGSDIIFKMQDRMFTSITQQSHIYLKSISPTQNTDCSITNAVYGEIGYSSFTPTYPCQAYMGQPGSVSYRLDGFNVSKDNRSVEISIAFPGETGFCGSFWSPLMLFFDKKRPNFKNSSRFPLNNSGKTTWPESTHEGYFLAFDRNGDGQITLKNELFGDQSSDKNGFDALLEFDTNGDKQISKGDKDFDKLLLWKDINGDGVGQKNEYIKLGSLVESISLKYIERLRSLDNNVEERQSATFVFIKNGKKKTGDIVDIWFAP
jgi:hypothetical protein